MELRECKGTPPFGWERVEESPGMIRPVPHLLEALQQAIDFALSTSMSVREAAKWLSTTTGMPLSHQALARHINKQMGQSDQPPSPKAEGVAPEWELHPEHYKTNPDGSFVLKKDGTPARKGRVKGETKAPYHYHSIQKAKMRNRANIRDKEKRAKQLEAKLAAVRASVKAKKEVGAKLDASYGSGAKIATTLSESDLEVLPREVREEVLADDANIAFRANPGPQTDFLAAGEKDVLYGGSAGGKDESFYRLLSTQVVKIKFVNCWKLLIPHITTTQLATAIVTVKKMWGCTISSQAPVSGEGSEAIPQGSRGAIIYIASRSANPHDQVGEDMVHSIVQTGLRPKYLRGRYDLHSV